MLQNPYYEWAKKQAEKQKTSGDSNGAMATTTSADATGTEKTTTSPLPQDAQASEPTDAKGTVDDRTVTGIEEQLNKEGETADSVTKTATEGTKEFYTISTKSGKIFYLIIDNSKSQDNVYFLTEVSEKDLMNFTLSDSVTLPEVDTVYAEPEKQAEEEKPETTETAEKDKVEDEIQMPEDKGPFGTYLLIALVAVGAAAGGYYFKVYKPKHEYDDEDEMEEDEDESEDSESEKREVDDADEQEEKYRTRNPERRGFLMMLCWKMKKRSRSKMKISDLQKKASVAMALASVIGARTRKRWLRGRKRLSRFLVRRTSGWIM